MNDTVTVADQGELPTIRVPAGWCPAAFASTWYCPDCWEMYRQALPGYVCGQCLALHGVKVRLEPAEEC